MTSTDIHKVIYDTDPGVDDAMALYFALAHPRIELVGITTVFGNVHVPQATANALYLTQLVGRNVPVVQGAGAPLRGTYPGPHPGIHGADGLGNLPSRAPSTRSAQAGEAAQYIVDMARASPKQITLVPVGPLTNIALALQLEPRLPELVREVVLMGGAAQVGGNVSPVAEANIWNDAHAADAVFTAGFKLCMVGLDVTHQLLMPLRLFESLAQHHQHPATTTLLHAVKFYAGFYGQRFAHLSGFDGCYGHDASAFIRLLHPELFTHIEGPIRVATDGLALGQTIINSQAHMEYAHPGWGADMPRSQACVGVNAAQALEVFESTLRRPWL
jgi:inosine-uridine nucleoside N-ribohydrolase